MNKQEEKELAVNIIEGLQWSMDYPMGSFVEALVQVWDIEQVIGELDPDEVKKHLGDTVQPEDVFTDDELDEWAVENGYVKASELDDVYGYEEREMY